MASSLQDHGVIFAAAFPSCNYPGDPEFFRAAVTSTEANGDSAAITVLKTGLNVPVAVTVVGNIAWELESKFNYRREPLKDRDPGVFAAYAVPLN